MTDSPFRILCVCTGNICRSPTMEALLRRALGEGFEVYSRGTHALVGEGVDPGMRALLDRAEVDTSAFVAAKFKPLVDSKVDLILTATRDQKRIVVSSAPLAMRKAFTLREFTRLAQEAWEQDILPTDTSAVGRMRVLTQALRDRRTPPVDPVAEDVVDPYRQAEDVFDTSMSQITEAVDIIGRIVHDGRH